MFMVEIIYSVDKTFSYPQQFITVLVLPGMVHKQKVKTDSTPWNSYKEWFQFIFCYSVNLDDTT